MHDVFVSHSSLDKAVADAIVARLETAGIWCWVAPRDVPAGSVWSEEIVRALETGHLMVIVLSGDAAESGRRPRSFITSEGHSRLPTH